jgi:cytoskeletal protein RodZ
MPTLGQELRKKREERGFSLKDISVHTKIGTRLLQAIEDDRFDLLPEPYFLKGVLRSYVQAIGADEQYFLHRLAEQTNTPLPLPKDELPLEEPRSRRRPRLRIVVSVLVILAAFAAAWYLIRATRSTPPPVVKHPVADIPAVKLLEAARAAVQARPRNVHEPALKLDISFTADTWITIDADGAKIYEGVRTAGESVSYTAEKELLLQIGNAGGFAFKLNGKPGKPLGPPGSVRTDIRITPATLADFVDGTGAAPVVR